MYGKRSPPVVNDWSGYFTNNCGHLYVELTRMSGWINSSYQMLIKKVARSLFLLHA